MAEGMHRQEKVRAAWDPSLSIRREAAAWRDAMDMRMVREGLAPGVEDSEEPDLGAEMLGSAASVTSASAAVRIKMA